MRPDERMRSDTIDGVPSPRENRIAEPEGGVGPAERTDAGEGAATSIPGGRPCAPPGVLRHSEWPGSRVGDPLVILGLAMWILAQALPAYGTAPFLHPEPDTTMGWQATLIAWDLAILGGSWAVFVAWTANLWFVLAFVARWRAHRRAALVFAVAAAACSAEGMWVLFSGGLPESGWGSPATITRIGTGSILWLASTITVVAGVTGWAWARPAVGSGSTATA
jgi:hypothetical protein